MHQTPALEPPPHVPVVNPSAVPVPDGSAGIPMRSVRQVVRRRAQHQHHLLEVAKPRAATRRHVKKTLTAEGGTTRTAFLSPAPPVGLVHVMAGVIWKMTYVWRRLSLPFALHKDALLGTMNGQAEDLCVMPMVGIV